MHVLALCSPCVLGNEAENPCLFCFGNGGRGVNHCESLVWLGRASAGSSITRRSISFREW